MVKAIRFVLFALSLGGCGSSLAFDDHAPHNLFRATQMEFLDIPKPLGGAPSSMLNGEIAKIRKSKTAQVGK